MKHPVIATLLAATALPVFADEEHNLHRIFVADHAEARVTAFDLSAPETRWTFDTTGQAKLYVVANGASVAAVQSEDDTVHFLASGIRLEDHGDHADIAVTEPTALSIPVTGPRPFHVIDHDGQIAIHFDQGGYALMLDGAALAEGTVGNTRFPQARAHHGFVTPFGDSILSTVASDAPVEGDAAPPRLGLQAFSADGSPQGELAPCTGIHGEAFSGAYLAAGCKEGVLTVTLVDGKPTFRMLPYSEGSDVTTGTLLGNTGMQIFLGNHGPDGLVVIDPAEEPHMRPIELPFRRVDFILDPAKLTKAYVLTEDGYLHRIDLLSAEIEASARVTEPYSMEGHWNDPRPRLAMAGDEVVMTDPKAGLLRRVSSETLKETGAIAAGGTPFNLVVVSGSGLSH